MGLGRFSIATVVALVACAGQAFQVVSLTPQGEVARVRQVVVKFDQSAVNFGDPKAAAPISIQCSDAPASRGSGRWISDREWAYEFEGDLPPGIACALQLRPGLKSAQGGDLSGATGYRFNTGGPFVQLVRPPAGSVIDEEQFFVLQLNGPASISTLQANLWCAVDGLGERVAVRLIEGKERAGLLKARNL